MPPNKAKGVVIVTTTSYVNVDELRFKLACRMLVEARSAGYSVVIVDDSSSHDVRSKFAELGAHIFPQLVKGMGPSRRQAFFHAAEVAKDQGAAAVFWIEPERLGMIQFAPVLLKIIYAGADIVVPQRTEFSWATYPAFQMESEKRGNAVVAEVAGRNDLDLFFGSCMYSLDAVKYVIAADPKKWGVADTYVPQYAPLYALRDGAAIASVPVDFQYPPEQTAAEGEQNEEMVAKRRSQLETVSAAMRRIGTMDM
jgi:hypothetical protein